MDPPEAHARNSSRPGLLCPVLPLAPRPSGRKELQAGPGTSSGPPPKRLFSRGLFSCCAEDWPRKPPTLLDKSFELDLLSYLAGKGLPLPLFPFYLSKGIRESDRHFLW